MSARLVPGDCKVPQPLRCRRRNAGIASPPPAVIASANRNRQCRAQRCDGQSHIKKSEFVYDSDGRKRISKEYSWDGVNEAWVQTDETRFVYDGMDLVQERGADGTVKASYVRDGNIGGILSRTTPDGTFYYHYDGNGNVIALTDANENIVAQYSYDAFGNTLSATGAQAEKNPFRFSSKYYDSDTGLYDYGLRHYASAMGRWINRDPIAEAGGLNLYGMVGNNPVNSLDEYGLAEWVTIGRKGIGPVQPFYEHAYLRLSKVYPELGSARTFGFYPASTMVFGSDTTSSGGGEYHKTSYIASPDPRQNEGVVDARNNDPLFEKMLVQVILEDYENTPNYLPGSVCGSWVKNVWERARAKTRAAEQLLKNTRKANSKNKRRPK